MLVPSLIPKTSTVVCQLQPDVAHLYQHQAGAGSAGDLKQHSKISLVCYTRFLPKTREGKTGNKVMK